MSNHAAPARAKWSGVARVAASYVLAFGLGLVWLISGPDTGRLWLDGLIADLIATAVVFVASRLHHNSSFYDAYWSVLPPLLALYWWVAADAGVDDARWWLLLAVMLVWAVRLTANWVYGFPGLHHEDWRYAKLRASAGKAELAADLFGIHVIPTLQVFMGMLGAYVVATRTGEPFGPLDVVALVVGVGAVTIETVADIQMHRFVASKKAGGVVGSVMDRGLWSWSRHPNYFGEWGFWLSVALLGLAADHGAWWVLLGPVAMLAMFYGASIPMMEERSLERRPDYAEVVARTSKFVPLPPRRTRAAA